MRVLLPLLSTNNDPVCCLHSRSYLATKSSSDLHQRENELRVTAELIRRISRLNEEEGATLERLVRRYWKRRCWRGKNDSDALEEVAHGRRTISRRVLFARVVLDQLIKRTRELSRVMPVRGCFFSRWKSSRGRRKFVRDGGRDTAK